MERMTSTFEYGIARINDLRVLTSSCSGNGLPTRPKRIAFRGESLVPTPRFWKSFFACFAISDKVFRYFGYDEVFRRVAALRNDSRFRYCIEREPSGGAKLLGATNPARGVISFAELWALIHRYGGQDAVYDNGVVSSIHTPRSGEGSCQIGRDDFQHRFVLETPVDGVGLPKIHLALLRLICANGMVGYSKAFRSEIRAGCDVAHCIKRALESYDNDGGYAALRQRVESAQGSWASIREIQDLYRTLVRLQNARQFTRQSVLADYYRATGRVEELYGLANLDVLSAKRQRVLPAECRVYDLMLFATELATHHTRTAGARILQAYIGSLISDEYDMEGTAAEVQEFRDFFAGPPAHRPPISLN
jgi:hypothetical protein